MAGREHPHIAVAPQEGGAAPRARVDPYALMRIRSLELRAKVVVEGFTGGLHRSPYRGFSVEFSEYREYSPGDDLRYLDWRVFARRDRYYLKQFEDETNARCYLLVDMSASMGYGSGAFSKADYARTLAATLAYFLATQRDAVGIVTFSDQIDTYLPPRYRPGHLHRAMLALERAPAGKGTDLLAPLAHVAATARKRGLVVLISDLLAPVEKLEVNLSHLRAQGHEVLVLRVLDPAERDFAFEGAALFEDAESGRTLYVDPAAAKKEYLRRFEAHAAAVTRVCNGLGIDTCMMPTDTPLELALFAFLKARQRRGRRVVRRERAPGSAGV